MSITGRTHETIAEDCRTGTDRRTSGPRNPRPNDRAPVRSRDRRQAAEADELRLAHNEIAIQSVRLPERFLVAAGWETRRAEGIRRFYSPSTHRSGLVIRDRPGDGPQ